MGSHNKDRHTMHTHSFTVKLFTLLTARYNCMDRLINKTISLEYNYYPGYYFSPSTMVLARREEEVTQEGWEVVRCGDGRVCLTNLSGPLGVETWRGLQKRLAVMTDPGVSVENPEWNVQFEVVCEDCHNMEKCSVVNRFQGGVTREEEGRMMADMGGWINFGYKYGNSYEEWFDWKLRILH